MPKKKANESKKECSFSASWIEITSVHTHFLFYIRNTKKRLKKLNKGKDLLQLQNCYRHCCHHKRRLKINGKGNKKRKLELNSVRKMRNMQIQFISFKCFELYNVYSLFFALFFFWIKDLRGVVANDAYIYCRKILFSFINSCYQNVLFHSIEYLISEFAYAHTYEWLCARVLQQNKYYIKKCDVDFSLIKKKIDLSIIF